MFFPDYPLSFKNENETDFIWDGLRKKWLVATPEEEVRQQLLIYLVQEKGISPKHIAVERAIKVYERTKRFDVVVFDAAGKPLILCECKAPHVPISQETAYQIGNYNLVLNAPFLLLTNGLQLFFYEVLGNGEYEQRLF